METEWSRSNIHEVTGNIRVIRIVETNLPYTDEDPSFQKFYPRILPPVMVSLIHWKEMDIRYMIYGKEDEANWPAPGTRYTWDHGSYLDIWGISGFLVNIEDTFIFLLYLSSLDSISFVVSFLFPLDGLGLSVSEGLGLSSSGFSVFVESASFDALDGGPAACSSFNVFATALSLSKRRSWRFAWI